MLFSSGREDQDKPIIAVSWVDEMRDHYYKTGEVRPEDLSRLLGSPDKEVYMRKADDDPQQGGNSPLFG